eukprot:TRINITY_DN15513_c0_g3_i1.p2 TRINITY_DN15513_c0_g3~~TRINITY_DN15513_c0_g3_i1.p2  ORF type:complete len:103 (-),score=4.28 TRINITY_DN15513_c0_g3_i1:32-340(-)
MVAEAEGYAQDDARAKELVLARQELENMAYSLKQNEATAELAQEILTWLDGNRSAGIEEIRSMMQEFQSRVPQQQQQEQKPQEQPFQPAEDVASGPTIAEVD